MDLSFVRFTKAGKPGPDNRRIYCNDDGVFIGPDCALIRAETDCAGHRSYQLRPPSEIARLLDAGYGTRFGVDSLVSWLNVIAKALNDGDMTLAQIATLQLGLPALADGAAVSRMAAADRLLKAGFDPNEPRDWHGRWTTGGSAGGGPRRQLAEHAQTQAAAHAGPPTLVHLVGFPDSIPPFTKPRIRGKDGYGLGYFGANRDYGRRHAGVDLVAPLGTLVTSPVSGRIAIFDPYGRD